MKTPKNKKAAIDNAKPVIENENVVVETKAIEPQTFKTIGFVQLPANKKQAVVGLKVHKNKGLMKAAQALAEKKQAKELETKTLVEKTQKAIKTAKDTLKRIEKYINEAAPKKIQYRFTERNQARLALGQIDLLCNEFQACDELANIFADANNKFAAMFGTLDADVQKMKDDAKNMPFAGLSNKFK